MSVYLNNQIMLGKKKGGYFEYQTNGKGTKYKNINEKKNRRFIFI